jgi:FMN phosphatase YigB (HAD superfamily)
MTNPPGIGALNLKAVLFDLGGTLHHYRREEVFRAVLKEKGIEVRIDEVLRAYDVTDPIFARLTAELPQEVMWPDQLLEQLDLMMLEGDRDSRRL